MKWKVHPYFEVARRWHPEVSLDDAIRALQNTEYRTVQPNGRVRRWGYVKELGYYVRVVLLEDEEAILNAFIDRACTRRYRI
jgi:hypothetical protein